jgi:hypothetical protein
MARGGPPNGMKVVPSWSRFSTCRVETHFDPLSASCYNRDLQRSVVGWSSPASNAKLIASLWREESAEVFDQHQVVH